MMHEEKGDDRREPSDKEDEGLGVLWAIEGEVELSEDGNTEPDEALKEAEYDATTLWEVFYGGEESVGFR